MATPTRRLLAFALVVAAAVLGIPLAHAAFNEDHPAGSIGAGYVVLGPEHLSNPSALDAFIPTQSPSQRCLVTFSESNFAIPGNAVHCVARNVDGVDGIRLYVPLAGEAPSDVVLALTVYQQFAKGYGTPVLYTGT
jgi:hypothetical protein